tara:strand:+ start:246 stop:845 length:600 start_codon:yes stop_codon:yes gene_type:complete
MKTNSNLFKRISIFSLFLLFFCVYFLIALLIETIPCPNWISNIDKYIPFIWWMIIPYYSYYILLIVPPFLIQDIEKIKLLTKTLIEMSIFCYIIYIIWPISSSNVLASVSSNPLDFLHEFITFKFLDQNALPSMHVSVTTTIGLAISKYKIKYKNLMLMMILGIFLATFLIKQHYLIDSITGLILGYIAFTRYKYLANI